MFWRKRAKVKNNFIINFHTFALRIETGRFYRVISPILKIRNFNDRCKNPLKHI